MEWAEPALICLNGHVVNALTELRPHLNSNYCPQCGEFAISKCPECETPIPGQVRNFDDFSGAFGYGDKFLEPMPYCGGCGSPFPWTERKAKAFIELAQIELSTEAAQEVEDNLPDVMRDSSRTEVAMRNIKRAFETMGQGSLDVLKEKAPEFLTRSALIVLEHLLSNPPR